MTLKWAEHVASMEVTRYRFRSVFCGRPLEKPFLIVGIWGS